MSTIGRPLVVLLVGEVRKAAALGMAVEKLYVEKDATPEWEQKYAEAVIAHGVAAHKALFHAGLYPESPIVVVSLKDLATVNTHTVEVVTKERPAVDKPSEATAPPNFDHCAVCGTWLVPAGVECVPGNCAMRPPPAKFYDPARATREAVAMDNGEEQEL